MPLTRLVADPFGVVTICLVSLLEILGFLCIIYLIYFHYHIRRQGFVQLNYFNRPWIIRISFILFANWWGFGEIIRLSFWKGRERVFHALSLKWQESICKIYIISNLGFAEPCLFLIIVFLLHASLQRREFGALSRKWNRKMAVYILLYCFPMFVLQLIVVFTGPKFNTKKSYSWKMQSYFTSSVTYAKTKDHDDIALCTYPLMSTILLGLFDTLLTTYLLWLGKQMVSSVINKRLRRRVVLLIFSVACFSSLRVLLLGLSVLSQPEHVLFEVLVFAAFLVLLCCAGLGICMLVYCPIADSLTLRGRLSDSETGSRPLDDHNDTASLIVNTPPSFIEASSITSPGRNSDASTKGGSISFRTMLKEEASMVVFEEVSLFSPGAHRIASPPDSPPPPGRPMIPLTQIYKS